MPALADIVHALCRRPIADADPLGFLGDVALKVTHALGCRGAVLVVPATGWVRGSDEVATLVGELQQRDGQGPVPASARTGRSIATADLTRIGPPALAALAAAEGLADSIAVVLGVDDRVVAVLQVLGRRQRPVSQADVDALGAVFDVVGARIVDLLELARLRRTDAPETDRTRAQRAASPRVEARPDPVAVCPEPRRPEPPRIRRVGLATAAPELVTEEFRMVGGAAPERQGLRPS